MDEIKDTSHTAHDEKRHAQPRSIARRPSARRRAALGALASVVIAGVLSAPGAEAAFLGDRGRIAFQRGAGGSAEIFSMRFNGADQVRLTNNTNTFDGEPAVAPDGRRIVFRRGQSARAEILTMNANGTATTQLTSNDTFDGNPAFSPDGSKIAFESDRDGNAEIYVMDANGANPVRLTFDAREDRTPAFSPDGTKIAFSRDGDLQIMSANGANQVQLTSGSSDDLAPSFAPDGARIAFQRTTSPILGSRRFNIRTIAPDGSGNTAITNSNLDFEPAFSPHGGGAQIAFESLRDDPRAEIHRMNANGSSPVRLTSNNAVDAAPDWGPAPRPAARIDFSPSGTTAQTAAVFAFSAPETLMAGPASEFECSLDGAPFAPCQTPGLHTVAGLADGTHTFRVRGLNATGTGPDAGRTWTVDTSEPSPPVRPAELALARVKPAQRKTVKPGRSLAVSARAGNRGKIVAVEVRACLILPAKASRALALRPKAALLGRRKACRELGVVEPGEAESMRFVVKAKRGAKPDRAHRVRLVLSGRDGTSGEGLQPSPARINVRVAR